MLCDECYAMDAVCSMLCDECCAKDAMLRHAMMKQHINRTKDGYTMHVKHAKRSSKHIKKIKRCCLPKASS